MRNDFKDFKRSVLLGNNFISFIDSISYDNLNTMELEITKIETNMSKLCIYTASINQMCYFTLSDFSCI